jgi:phosphotransferase system  glucose/maltose/N-acetylglucosamine-specific IIC component
MGLSRPSAAERSFAGAPPLPPWSLGVHFGDVLVAVSLWSAALLGGAGVALGLVAVRRGWRPAPRLLLIGSALAVIALLLVGPMGSGDMLDYAAFGRIAVLGHSPYLMTVAQLRAAGDPVGRLAPYIFQHNPSVYGPLATASEWLAARLGGTSAARIVFWLKLWNALAYLAIAVLLDRLLRDEPAQRLRAHLLWSVNPLMLLAVMAGGHVDGLAAGFGVAALIALRRLEVRQALLAGLLAGAATAVKAEFLIFAFGLAWATWRRPQVLAAAAAGVIAVLIPAYLLAGHGAVSADLSRASASPVFYVPWQLLLDVVHLANVNRDTDVAGVLACGVLAVIFLWRLPAGPASLPAVRPALAVSLAWLMVSPQQRPWYDAMLFPLVALMPATRLDWIVLFRGTAGAIAELPGITYYLSLHPGWLSRTGETFSLYLVPACLTLAIAAALVLCWTGRWAPGRRPDGRASGTELAAESAAGAPA